MTALIVEDHPSTAALLAETLRRCGLEPEIRHSAEEAMDLLTVCGVSAYDFYFLDLQLPGANGIALCEWIRVAPGGSHPHIIVATGADHTEVLSDVLKAGANDYLEKPFTPRMLALRLALARKQREGRIQGRRMNREMRREKDFMATVFDAAAACIVALDRQGRIVKANQAAIGILGQDSTDLKGCCFGRLLAAGVPDQADPIARKIERLAGGAGETCQFDSRFSAPGRDSRHLAWHCRRVVDHATPGTVAPNEAFIVCVGTDITERRKKEARLAFHAQHDPLTRLYNRSQIEPAIRRAIRGMRTCSNPAGLMCIDLDCFKAVNDHAGHAAGDDVLRQVARTLSEMTRSTDTVIRLGGDEFVLVLPNSPEDRIQAVAERIRSGIDALRFEFGGRTFRVTVSIGVALLTATTGVGEALARADAACYASKRSGRNRIHMTPALPPPLPGSPDLDQGVPRRRHALHHLEPARLALAG